MIQDELITTGHAILLVVILLRPENCGAQREPENRMNSISKTGYQGTKILKNHHHLNSIVMHIGNLLQVQILVEGLHEQADKHIKHEEILKLVEKCEESENREK